MQSFHGKIIAQLHDTEEQKRSKEHANKQAQLILYPVHTLHLSLWKHVFALRSLLILSNNWDSFWTWSRRTIPRKFRSAFFVCTLQHKTEGEANCARSRERNEMRSAHQLFWLLTQRSFRSTWHEIVPFASDLKQLRVANGEKERTSRTAQLWPVAHPTVSIAKMNWELEICSVFLIY